MLQLTVTEMKRSKILHRIHGIEVKSITPTMDTNTSKILQYHADVNISIGIKQ
jgi:hypothetical protein